MELALYHETLGYYSEGSGAPGKKGDYFTSPTVHRAFGETVAAFISKALRALGSPDAYVIEAGGGTGYLALDILDAMKNGDTGLYERLSYTVIERSAAKRHECGSRLRGHAQRVRVIGSAQEVEGQQCGVVLSNELFDALPFHRMQMTGGVLKEIFVTYGEEGFGEVLGDPADPALTEHVQKNILGPGIELREGQKIEVCPAATAELEALAGLIERGFVLTIDYGSLTENLYHPTRPEGTLKCFRGHSLTADPYGHIGSQDITADTDFGTLIRTGGELGLAMVMYTTQGQFLVDWGILDIYEGLSVREPLPEKDLLAIKTLFLPGMMGASFKVLLQTKGMDGGTEGFYPPSPLRLFHGDTP